MGLTRDAVTVRPYRRNGLLSVDPVQTLDPAVLDFVRTSLASVKSFEIQVAAEQANDSQAVIDLVLLGASVFSCVPARFDGLRLSAAKAVIARDSRTIAP